RIDDRKQSWSGIPGNLSNRQGGWSTLARLWFGSYPVYPCHNLLGGWFEYQQPYVFGFQELRDVWLTDETVVNVLPHSQKQFTFRMMLAQQVFVKPKLT